MNGWERSCYTLAILLSTVPMALLRFWPFRKDVRIPVWAFWSIYAVILLSELVWMNTANWPEPLGFAGRQRGYLAFMLLYTMLFFLAIRRFWQQVFVFGILCVYGAPVLILPPLLGNHFSLGQTVYLMNCLVMTAEYLLTWRWMQRFLEDGLTSLYRMGTPMFWRLAWLLPFGFFVVEITFSVEHVSGNLVNPVSLILCYLGAAGLLSGIRSMQRCIDCLQENRILAQNIGEASQLYELQLNRCRQLAEAARSSRKLRHDLRHFAMELENHLLHADWSGFRKSLRLYRQKLFLAQERLMQRRRE